MVSSFTLKIIGIISMLCDHYSDIIIGDFTFLNLIGRLALPIFAFQIVQGYIHTSNIKKYIIRIFIFACVSQLPFYLFKAMTATPVEFNVLFTFLLGIIALMAYDKIKNKILGFSTVVLIGVIAQLIKTDFRWFGIACIFLFYIFSKSNDRKKDISDIRKKVYLCILFIALVIIFYLKGIILNPSFVTTYLETILFTCISLVPICLYNGKQGPKIKYLFYAFYPFQFIFLWLLEKII